MHSMVRNALLRVMDYACSCAFEIQQGLSSVSNWRADLIALVEMRAREAMVRRK